MEHPGFISERMVRMSDTIVRCRKCHKILKSSQSILLGMGPKCAGLSAARKKSVVVKRKRPSGNHHAVGPSVEKTSLSLPIFYEDDITPLDAASKPIAFKTLRALMRPQCFRKQVYQIRRQRFEQRLAFAPGLFILPGHKPIVYEPVGTEYWLASDTGHLISHIELGKYLQNHGRI